MTKREVRGGAQNEVIYPAHFLQVFRTKIWPELAQILGTFPQKRAFSRPFFAETKGKIGQMPCFKKKRAFSGLCFAKSAVSHFLRKKWLRTRDFSRFCFCKNMVFTSPG